MRALTGVPIYLDRLGVPNEKIPYGNDGTRWVPELSALLVQSEALISSQAIERLGGDGLEVTYAPFEGRSRTLDFGDAALQGPARLLVGAAARTQVAGARCWRLPSCSSRWPPRRPYMW